MNCSAGFKTLIIDVGKRFGIVVVSFAGMHLKNVSD